MFKSWQRILGALWVTIILVSAHPTVQRAVDRLEEESERPTPEEAPARHEDEGATEPEEPSPGTGEPTVSPPPAPVQPEPTLPPYALDQVPNRPSWLGISGEPTEAERRGYEERVERYRTRTTRSDTGPTRFASVRERILRIRDRVILQEDVPGAWRWPQVRTIIAAFGTPERPIVCDTGGHTTEGCLAFTQLNQDFLGINEVATVMQSDREIAGAIVHEATHIALQKEYERYSGFTGHEHAALVNDCGDVARTQLLVTETVAFYNQARYISTTSPTPPALDVEDPCLEAISAGYNGDEGARQRFMQYIQTYVTIEMRHVRPVRCGLPVAVRGPYQGRYVLFYDLAQSEIAPFFAYGSALP